MKIERAKKIYEELNKYQMQLASDPVSLGPKYLQDCIATLRNWTNRVSFLLMEVHQEKQQLMKELDALEGAYEIDYAELLATDERVTQRANIKDREAAIKTILRDQLRDIQAKKREIADLGHVEKAIKHRHKEIRDTIGEVREQRALVRAEIDTGAMYGDERPSSTANIVPEEIDEDELSTILDGSGISRDATGGEDGSGPSADDTVHTLLSHTPVQRESGPTESPVIVGDSQDCSPETPAAPKAESDETPVDHHIVEDLAQPAQSDASVNAFLAKIGGSKAPEMTDEDLSFLLG